uniref:Uncharacterized protein n=1 Tax=Globodera rostochiensis TaxID=31243 RepID=A0A914HUP2_GLORO
MPRSAQIGLRPRIFGFERVNNPADDHSKCADIDKQKINVLINATLIKETVPELIKLYVTNRVTQEHWRRRSWLGAEKPGAKKDITSHPSMALEMHRRRISWTEHGRGQTRNYRLGWQMRAAQTGDGLEKCLEKECENSNLYLPHEFTQSMD